MVAGLAALGAGGGGFLDAYNTQYDAETKQLGEMAFGRTLQMLGQGAQQPQMGGGMPPGGMPPQPGMGGFPGMPPPGPQGGPPMQPPMQGGGGPPPQGPPMQPPMQGGGGPPPQGPPMGGAPGGGMPPPGGPPGMPPGGGGQPPMGGGQPVLDWRMVMQKVSQANPGLPPNALAAAVDRFMPLMNQQSQQQWREMSMMLRQQGLDIAQQRADTTAAQGGQRLQQGQERIDAAAGKETKKTDEAQEIGDAIIRGEQPPVTTGLWRVGPDVKAYLASKGFNQSKAISEWNGAQAAVRGWNSQRMLQYRGLAKSVSSTIDEVQSLSEQLQLNGLTSWNRIRNVALTKGASNTAAGQQAIAYVTAVNTLKSEFAQLENGGYAPTDEVWKLANQQISSDYGVKGMDASLNEIQKLINFRLTAIQDVTGGGGENRYQGGGGQPAGETSKPPNQKPGKSQFQERFEGLPEGWSVQEH